MVCPECFIDCKSHSECLKMQDFNLVVDQAKAVAKLKKSIKISTPYFKGKSLWFHQDYLLKFRELEFSESLKYNFRFMTVTFDPRKFPIIKLINPKELLNYAFNALYNVKELFASNPITVIEYHKSGIPHLHINYECKGVMEHATFKLQMQYYFSKDLRNKRAIHDRVFNDGGVAYLRKDNQFFLSIKDWHDPVEQDKNIVQL